MLTVGEYRQEQGVTEYDETNREWRQVVLKKRSSGPTVGKPSQKSWISFISRAAWPAWREISRCVRKTGGLRAPNPINR